MAVQKDAVVGFIGVGWKLVFAFALLVLTVSCDYGRPNKGLELDMTDFGEKIPLEKNKQTNKQKTMKQLSSIVF